MQLQKNGQFRYWEMTRQVGRFILNDDGISKKQGNTHDNGDCPRFMFLSFQTIFRNSVITP
jgi:hypothetical protein